MCVCVCVCIGHLLLASAFGLLVDQGRQELYQAKCQTSSSLSLMPAFFWDDMLSALMVIR